MFHSVLMLVELFAVAIVILATIHILQSSLVRAHILLRLGLTLVCAGSVIEFYETMTYVDTLHLHTTASAVENVGQAIIYGWIAMSKRLWESIGAIGE